jgi:hypothetical protein
VRGQSNISPPRHVSRRRHRNQDPQERHLRQHGPGRSALTQRSKHSSGTSVIDGNGEGINIGGKNGASFTNNFVENNVISNSKVRKNLDSWCEEAHTVDSGNVVSNNCLCASDPPDRKDPPDYIQAHLWRRNAADALQRQRNNTVAQPKFIYRANKLFRLKLDSPCVGVLVVPDGSGFPHRRTPRRTPPPMLPVSSPIQARRLTIVPVPSRRQCEMQKRTCGRPS